MTLLVSGANGASGSYQISRSVRLRRNSSAYLNRTFASAGNRYTWTFSCWIKKSVITDDGNDTVLFSTTGASAYYDSIRFNNSTGTLYVYYSGGTAYASTPSNGAVFRDASAWYHIIVAQDTTQSTEALRLKIWINGVQQTLSSIPGLNYQSGFNTASEHDIGKEYARSVYADCYMTEIRFIDGQSLTSTSFGAFDTTTGVWNPVRYSGTYGTNGFYLNFSDNSGATATTIGKDSSGNGNNWTPNNISVTNVTAPNTNDSMVDTPTNYGSDTGAGGEVRGNYAVLNPLAASTWTFSNGNLTGYGGYYNCYFSMPIIGKMYFEVYCSGFVGGGQVGFVKNATIPIASIGYSQAGYYGVNYAPTNSYWVNGSNDATAHGTVTNNTMKFAVDGATGKVWIGSGSTWFGSGDPVAGTNPAFTLSLSNGDLIYPMLTSQMSRDTFTINTGQLPFGNAAPSGFKAMCTQNMPEAAISNGAKYMAATLYTGNGTSQSLVNTVNGISFQPDLVWTKCRSTGNNQGQIDSVRGISRWLGSSTTLAENYTAGSYVTAFNNNGFSVGTGGVSNENGQTYVGWQWKGNGTAVSNTAGSITSSVSANTTAGFSILTYTGNGTVGATVGHGLGVTPAMVIVKSRSTVQDWPVKILPYMTGGQRLELDTTNSITTEAAGSGSLWNATNPNSTVITLGDQAMTNANGTTYVAYCWAQITGYSAFGSYTGNGSSDGPFIYCGFRPRWIMLKRADAANHWIMYDTSRDAYNVGERWLRANTADVEATGIYWSGVSNGFKIQTTDVATNGSGGTYVYVAFAENPFTISRAR